MHSPVLHPDDPPGAVYIRMICATDSNQILSAVVFGVMEDFLQQDLIDFANKTHLAGIVKKNSLGASEMTLTKVAAKVPATDRKVTGGVKSPGSHCTQRKRHSCKVRNKSQIPVQLSSIQVNCLSGPFGTANGMAVEGLSRMATDRLVTGSIPRNAYVICWKKPLPF
jgi:hypothetical protein